MHDRIRVDGPDCIWQTVVELAAHFLFPREEGRISFSQREGGRRGGKNTSTLVPPRSSFPRGWSSRPVASASNLTKLNRAISRRFADVRVPLPVPLVFICTTTTETVRTKQRSRNVAQSLQILIAEKRTSYSINSCIDKWFKTSRMIYDQWSIIPREIKVRERGVTVISITMLIKGRWTCRISEIEEIIRNFILFKAFMAC